MTLAPKLPPGRANRKALQFAVDIRRLRQAGYTCSAIRLVLLEAGVSISLSTVKREAARKDACVARSGFTAYPAHPPSEMRRPLPTDAFRADAPDAFEAPQKAPRRSEGHIRAQAFFDANPTNPLIRREAP